MTEAAARFAYTGLERVLHERGRLAVCTCLVAFPEGLTFGDLRQECGMTDGNLSRHLKVLAETGLVELQKNKVGARLVTICRITEPGRDRFLAYLDVLESVVRDAQVRAARSELRGGSVPDSGWAVS